MFQKTKRDFITPVLIIFFLVSSSGYILAQTQISVEELLDNFRKEYEESIQNIDNYTLVTNLYTHHYVKVWENGRPYFELKGEFTGLEDPEDAEISGSLLHSPQLLEELKSRAEYQGTSSLNGFKTHIVFSDKLSDLFPAEEETHIEFRNVKFYIDTADLVIRKIEYEMKAEIDGRQPQTINQSITMDDYRDIEGMMIPYKTTLILEGITGAMTEEERQEAEQAVAQLEQQMEQMSEQEQEMMRQMVGPQLEEYRKIMEEDRMEQTITVQEVRINVENN
jgi:hypothetical protein